MSEFPDTQDAAPRVDAGSILKGFGIGALVNLGALVAGGITIMVGIGILVLVAFGVVQFAWIGPMYYRFRNRGQTETAKGLLIAAGISFLLNAGCWGMIGTLNFH